MGTYKALRGMGFAVGMAMGALTAGQSINADLNFNAPPEVGGGVPSDSFGAAANQPGRWNNVYVIGHADWLYGLDGNLTSATLSIDASNLGGNITGGGFRNESNSGDFARLLNDAGFVDDRWRSWTFHGLQTGSYLVTVYAVQITGNFSRANVSVSNSVTPNPQTIQGTMPGNSLVHGVTHSTHLASVDNGDLEIVVSRDLSDPIVTVNGFQITHVVPEPTFLTFVTLALGGLFVRRKAKT